VQRAKALAGVKHQEHRDKLTPMVLRHNRMPPAANDRDLTNQVLLVYTPQVATTTTDLTEAARVFHALSDETRLGIMEMLQDGERCVCDLQGQLDAAQSRLSFHLKVLRDAGLVTDRKEGRWSYYSIKPESLATVHDLVVGMRPASQGTRKRLPINARCCG
jgi:ArsR family transcriptional regulator